MIRLSMKKLREFLVTDLHLAMLFMDAHNKLSIGTSWEPAWEYESKAQYFGIFERFTVRLQEASIATLIFKANHFEPSALLGLANMLFTSLGPESNGIPDCQEYFENERLELCWILGSSESGEVVVLEGYDQRQVQIYLFADGSRVVLQIEDMKEVLGDELLSLMLRRESN